MGNWNLGSVAAEVLILVPSVPSTLSGAPTERIADRQRLFMEQYTGQTIGSTGIAEQFQPALLHLTCADVLSSMELEGVDASNVRLGEFSISKGTSSNISSAKLDFKKQGMEELDTLGRRVGYYQAL